jgi:hypothetical protein
VTSGLRHFYLSDPGRIMASDGVQGRHILTRPLTVTIVMTERYAHVTDDALRRTIDGVARQIRNSGQYMDSRPAMAKLSA